MVLEKILRKTFVPVKNEKTGERIIKRNNGLKEFFNQKHNILNSIRSRRRVTLSKSESTRARDNGRKPGRKHPSLIANSLTREDVVRRDVESLNGRFYWKSDGWREDLEDWSSNEMALVTDDPVEKKIYKVKKKNVGIENKAEIGQLLVNRRA